MHLVIVESPTKAKKLNQYLGKDFVVKASFGHIRDLPKKELGVDVEDNFKPTYITTGKRNVVSELKQHAAKADTIILATDPDREGEAIAWHVKHILESARGSNKISAEFRRATFHEITKAAVLAAIDNPGELNSALVDAQQARRVLDRLVGYQVSPVLWRKVRRGLSAGRVQSVALRLLVDREREIQEFTPEEYWEVAVALSTDTGAQPHEVFVEGKPADELEATTIITQLVAVDQKKFAPKTADDVAFLKDYIPSAQFSVQEIETKPRKRSSAPPFTTSTLQQQAASRFGYSGKRTMQLAQQLYEEGLITYHRTDSVNVSKQAIAMAREYISATFSEDYLPAKPNYYKSRSKNAQEAHEAIRVTQVVVAPSDVLQKSSRFTGQHQKLYELIWRRFLSSQMAPAQFKQTAITINGEHASDQRTLTLRTTGSILVFAGWLALYPSKDDVLLPDVSQGQALAHVDHALNQKFTQPPARYNDASLVKELEKRGIGRPSTYASIISVLIDRGYVEREQKRFFVSSVGTAVVEFLAKHFPVFMEYEFTAKMEDDLDKIALGDLVWQEVLQAFYKPFHERVDDALENAERVQIPVEKTGEKCPECDEGEQVIRSGKYGKFKSCSRFPDCKFTQNIVEKIDGVCPLCDKGEIIVKKSRWGKPFYGCGRYPDCDWASWKKPEKGLKLTAEEWAQMQAERKARAAKRKKTMKSKAAKKKTTKKTTKKKSAKKKTKK